MIDIIVTTGLGNSIGKDILSPMFTDTNVALIRGTMEVDLQANQWTPTTVTIPFRPNVNIGDLTKIVDTTVGITSYGKIVSITVEANGVEVTLTLKIEVLV